MILRKFLFFTILIISLSLINANVILSNLKISDGLNGFAPENLSSFDIFGSAIANIGDLDNDGVIDIAVGAPSDENLESGEGAVYILFLNANGSVKNNLKISDGLNGFAPENLNSSDTFGSAIANIGDLDNDGIIDIAVGASNDENLESNEGAVYILFLNANGSVKNNTKISDGLNGFTPVGLDAGDQFGSSIANIGDLDNDGVIDIVVGAPSDENLESSEGAVYILFLNTDGSVKNNTKISDGLNGFVPVGLGNSDDFGSSIANIGDLNNDGVTDIVVGAPSDENGQSSEGAAYILFLNTNGSVKNNTKISDGLNGFTPSALDFNDFFGDDVELLGDINGDNIQDIIIGANNDESSSGGIYIIELETNGSVKNHTRIINGLEGFSAPSLSSADFGLSIVNLGDLNGNGKIDLMVGAPLDEYLESGEGAIHFLGTNYSLTTSQTSPSISSLFPIQGTKSIFFSLLIIFYFFI
jgi:hypothetical protein